MLNRDKYLLVSGINFFFCDNMSPLNQIGVTKLPSKMVYYTFLNQPTITHPQK